MKSGKRLDSAVFQLTPTRTRYDLVIIANGKTEKIASGLLTPFLAHMKTAQDQIAKGGYSITLEPVPGGDSSWFTKGTVERFIRFVSNPEVLERVNTIESEIMQIEEAIVIQGNENIGLNTVDDHKRKVEDHPTKSMETNEGSRPVHDTDAEKAIVLYTPGVHPPEPIKSAVHEENSRVQLLRVLETRRTVLQKEQGMAFARAVAAGFDMDHMPYLVSFAECFGASRLMDACLRFSELWKVKHESGQWLDIEQSEAIAARPDLSPMLISEAAQLCTESNGKANNDSCTGTDKRPPMDAQTHPVQHDFIPAQFQHPMFPQWPVHTQPGAVPVFQPYPMQGIPYYQNYPGGGPFFQPPYASAEDPRFSTPQRMGMRRHSMESKDSHGESDSWENGITSTRSHDGSEMEKDGSQGQESRRKACRSSKKQSSKVVIRNINYITSNRQDSSGSETQSDSNPETDEEPEGFQGVEHKKSLRSSKSEEICTKSTETWNSYDNNGAVYGQETGGGNWKAFQTCLLRDDSGDMFSMEKEGQMERRKNAAGPDPIVPCGRDLDETQNGRMAVFNDIDGKVVHKLRASDDEMVISQREFTRQSRNGQVDVHTTEIEGSKGRYKRGVSDDFMIGGQESQSSYIRSQSDPLNENGVDASCNLGRNSTYNAADESFIIPLRSGSQDQSATRSSTAIDMDPELPPGLQKIEDSSSRIRSQLSYEPDALSLIPERRIERESIGYDPALEYEMQVSAENAVSAQNRNKEDSMSSVKQGSKDKKSKGMPSSLEKRKIDAAMKRGKPSQLNPPNEAQARADKLRAFKADLQKMKREKDEEDRKRIEALKMERQKRIAARNSSSNAQSSFPSQTKSRQPLKLSPSSHKGSKFSDSEPGSSSPLQRLPIRTASVGYNESHKITKPSKLSIGGRITGSGLSRSVSSLPELKKQSESFTPEPKVSTRQIRRLSDPKMNKTPHVSSVKLQSINPSPKPKVSDGTEIKKISAIMSLDKTKAAALPELKIKTSRGPTTMVHKKPIANEVMHNVNADKSIITPEVKNKNGKSLHDNNVDENPVIEKTVVMLEPEVPSVPFRRETGEKMDARNGSCDSDLVGDKSEILEYAAIHAPPSPLIMDKVVQGTSECHLNELPYNHQVPANYEGKELSKFSTMTIAEKPYHAPYARVSSLEDRSTRNSDYTTASPRSPETSATLETTRVNGPEFKDLSSAEQILESTEKPRGKESSKGFKRFLKLGKKNHSPSAEQRDMESDKLSVDVPLADDQVVIPAASNEAHTLKNLISQSETPTTSGTPQKASRTFSLLSPFRSKTSEKKLTTS